MIPEGDYKAIPKDHKWSYTKDGKERVSVQLEILEGDDSGTKVWWDGYFTEKTTKRTLEALRYLGWDTDDLADMFLDQEVVVVIEHETDERGTRARARWINRPGAVAAKPIDEAALRAFSARIKGQAPPPLPKQAKADEIPF